MNTRQRTAVILTLSTRQCTSEKVMQILLASAKLLINGMV